MNKKQIIILIIVFLFVIFISAILVYHILGTNKSIKPTNSLKVGEYTLSYGKYKGYEKEYNYDIGTVETKEITLNLTKNKINDETYEVKGRSLYVNGYEMYKVIANNKIKLLAGEGVDFEYEGK